MTGSASENHACGIEHFFHNGINYSIHRHVVDELSKAGVMIDGQYIAHLLKWRSPFKYNDICLTDLVCADIRNRNARSTLGRFVQYNQDGDFVQTFDNLYDVVMSPDSKRYLYGFERLYEDGMALTRSNINFFGARFKPLYNQQSFLYPHVTALNCYVRELVSWRDGSRAKRVYDDLSFGVQYMSFEEFKNQKMRYACFTSNFYIHPQIERYELDKQEYQTTLNGLLNRYSHNNISLFEGVQNLDDYSDCCGVYILCFPNIRSFYVGQTRDCLLKRIRAHFQQPKTKFDISIGCLDVKSIYILKCPVCDIDILELDCIASIPSKFLLNHSPGAGLPVWRGDPQWTAESFLLPDEKFQKIKKKLFKRK